MNKSLHRIVFNKKRGLLMAVAETAASDGKAPGTSAGPASHGFTATLRSLSFAMFAALGLIALASPLANAQIVADPNAPRNQQPTVLNAGNGVPVVNIQTPSAAGVSRNTYSQFDVNGQGAILNNSRSNVQTQLGGWVQGNPWLATGTARVILNEVNASNPSQLRGYIEVAGDRAQVVIANAAGITCDGCGFLNASRATLTTGTPIVNGGSLDGYRVQRGVVSIEGAGLDASRTDYTDIVARAVQVNAGIWANELKVTTGANEVDADHTQATPTVGSGTAPAFAIDVAQLGGMYAGKITLVGTEAGVGVRNAGVIGASAGDVVVTAEGRLENAGRITATGNVLADTQGGIANSGVIYAGAETGLGSHGDIGNSGLIAAQRGTALTATGVDSQVNSTAGSVLAAGLQADGRVGSDGILAVLATGGVTARGQNLAGSAMDLSGTSIDVSGSQTSAPSIGLRATSADIDASRATLAAAQMLAADAAQTLRTDGAQVSAAQLTLAARSVSNVQGELVQAGSGDMSLQLAGELNNTGGRIATNSQNLALSAQTLANTDGRIEHAGSGELTLSTSALDGERGYIGTQGHLAASTGQTQLNGATTVANRIDLQATSLSNRGGQIVQSGGGSTTLGVTQSLDNTGGAIVSSGNTTIAAQSLVNRGGTVQAAGTSNLHVSAGGQIDNSAAGTIAAGGSAVLNSGSLNNQGGRVSAANNLEASASQGIDNTDGVLVSNLASSVAAASLDNTRGVIQSGAVNLDLDAAFANTQGQVFATGDLRVRSGDLHNTGSLYAQGQTSVASTGTLTNAGVVAAQGRTTLQAQHLQSQAGSLLGAGIRGDGTLAASGDLTIATADTLTAHGQNLAAGEARLTGSAVDLSGSQTGAVQVSVRATQGDISTRQAVVSAAGTLGITANGQVRQTLDNSAGQLSAQQLDLHLANLSNTHGDIVQTGAGDSSITGLDLLDNTGGRIASNGGNLSLSAQTLTNTDGRIEHAGSGALSIEAATLNGARGVVVGNGALLLTAQAAMLDAGSTVARRVTVDTQTLSNRGGQIVQTGTDAATVNATTRFDNTGGLLAGNGATTLRVGDLLNQGGTVQAAGAASLDVTGTGQLDNSAQGTLTAGGNVVIHAGQLNNGQGRLLAGASLTASVAQGFDNTEGLVAANQNLALTAANLDNTRGTLQALGSSTVQVSGALENTQGQIHAGADVGVQAGALSNSGSLYAQGNTSVATAGALSNTGVIAAQGNTTLQGGRIDSMAGSLLAAGLRSDGSLTDRGDLSVTSTQALAAHGQNIAAGSARFTGTGVDLSGSQTGAANVALAATQGDITTRQAVVSSAGTLSATANQLAGQTLDNDAGQVTAAQLDLRLANLSNVQGALVQTGAGDTSIALSGNLDNTGGRIAANSRNLALSAQTLANAGGRIEHANTGTLAVDATTLDGTRGVLASNGTLQLTAQSAVLDAASTVAAQLQLDTATLSNRGGQLIQTGTGAMAVTATTRLDNTGGLLASNGSATLTLGELVNRGGTVQAAGAAEASTTGLLDNSADGLLTAGGNTVLNAGQLNNANGRVLAGASLTATVAQAADNTDGVLAANNDLNFAAASLDNTRGTTQALGAVGLQLSGALNNSQGQAYAGGDLTVRSGDVNNTGSLYAQGHNSITSSGALTNTGVIAAQGNTTLQAHRLDSQAGSLLAAGLRADGTLAASGDLSATASQTLAAHGQNIAAGAANLTGTAVDLSNSQTSAAELALTATQGTITTSQAVVSASGTLSATANSQASQALDNDAGQLTAAQLDLHVANLSNVQGLIVQTGGGDTTIAVSGQLDNTDGRLAVNSRNLAVTAQTVTNAGGRIEHAGTGNLSVNTTTFDGVRGQVASNGTLRLTATDAVLDAGSTVAQRLQLQAQTLSNRGGRIIQTGSGTTLIQALARLDNTGGTLASNGDTRLVAGDVANQGGTIQAAGLNIEASGVVDNRAQGSLSAGGALSLTAAEVRNAQGQITAGQGLQLNVSQAIDNTAGVLAARGDVSVSGSRIDNTLGTIGSVQGSVTATATSGALDNSTGRIEAAQAVTVTATGLTNTDGVVAGQDVRIDSRAQALDNTRGTLAARGTLEVQSGALDNEAGLLQAGGVLTVDTHGQALTNTHSAGTGGILGPGTVTLATGELNNEAGFIGSHGNLTVTSTAAVRNTQAGTLTSESAIALQASSLDNRGGQVQALGDVTIDTGAGSVDNTASLMRSGGTLSITAGSLLNANAQGANQGLEGRSVALTFGTLDNTAGAIRADESLTLTGSGSFGNNQGLVSSGRTVSVLDANASANTAAKTLAVGNTAGMLIAGEAVTVDTASLSGDGKLLSQGDLTVKLSGDYTHTGDFQANGTATLQTTGTLTNQAKLLAGNTLNVSAANIDNTASGEISATRTNVSAGNTLTNRGLIDGQQTFVSAGTLNNVGTGRLYGDHVAISATTLNNDVENGTAATIAARARLDIGAQTLTNREHALIFSAGDMAVGGGLDANHLATGQAGTVDNRSATIEALGNLDLSARQINNTNEHFSTQVVEVSRESRRDFQLVGSPNIYDSTQASQNNGAADGLLQTVTPEGTSDDFARYDYNRVVTETQVLTSDPGQILAGGAMRVTADALVNDRSRIVAGATLTGSIGTLSNLGADGQRTTSDSGTSTHFFRIRHRGSDEQGISTVAYNPAATIELITVGMATYLQNTSTAGTGTQIAALATTTVTQNATGAGAAIASLRSGTLIEVRAAVTAPVSASGSTVATATGSNAGTGTATIGTATAVNAPGAASSSTVASATGASVSRNAAAVDSASAVTTPSAASDAAAAAATGTTVSHTTAAITATGESATAPAPTTAEASFVIRAVVPNTTLPNSSLFRQNPDANSRFLVETDPRFADYRTWLSSDYLLQQLELDPATTQMRLGDGFYEQKLVREQVAQLTGRRFLEGYANDEAEYQALMSAGATYAKQWKLVPGVALTPEQMAQLTTDIVWLVERPVTLADGSVRKVLVPQVYVRVQEGDLDGSGALLSAGAIGLNLRGDLNNSGTIAGRTVVSLSAENVQNLGGRISGQDVAVSARNDLNHLGGLIDGSNSLMVTAGRDLNVVSSTNTATNEQSSRTNVSRVAGLYVSNAGGTLVASAGRDINLIAASIVNAGEGGQTVIAAGHDLKLGTVTESSRQSITWDANNWRKDASSTEVGTAIQAVGDVRLSAANDLSARAANVTSTQGALVAVAGNNLSVTAGEATRSLDEAHKVTGSNSWTHNKTTTTRDTFNQTAVVGSALSGNTVVLQAGNKVQGTGDLLIQGSSVTAQGAAVLSAGRDVTISSAEQTTSSSHDSQTVKTPKGFAQALGTAMTVGSVLTTGLPSPEGARLLTKKSNAQGNEQTTTQAVGSTVSAGTLAVDAGRDATIKGSTLVADGTIDVNAARNLNIVSAQDTQSSTSSASSRTSGFVGSWWQPAVGTVKQNQTGQEQTTTQVASQVASLNGSVNLRAGEQYTQTSSQVLAPQGNIDIQAKQVDIGAAHDSGNATQTSQYSRTAVGGTVSVPLLNAVQGVQQSVQAGKTSGDARMQALAAVNAGFEAQAAAQQVANNGVAGGIKVSVSLGHSESRSQSTQSGSTAAGSQVVAGGDVSISATGAGQGSRLTVTGSDIKAGGDANLRSDGALTLQAAKNTAEQHSTNSSGGASVGVGFALGGQQNGFTLEASASRSLGQAGGTDASHANTHVSAGNALNLRSGGDTTLKGAVASGRQVTADVGGNLNVESLQDTTKYDAKQQSAGVSVSVCVPPFCYGSSSVSGSASQAKVNGDFVSVTEQSAMQAGDGGFQVNVRGNTDLKGAAISSTQAAIDAGKNSLTTATLTTSDLQNKDDYKATAVSVSGGTGGGSAGASQVSGHQASTTRAGISAGQVVITDDKLQQAVSGQSAEQTVASINRDVLTGRDTSGALGQAWDGQRLQDRVQAEASITAQFGQNAARAIGDYAGGKVKELRTQAATETDAGRRQALLDEAAKWEEGGAYRVAAHAVVGGLTGGMQGAAGAAASASAAPVLDDLQGTMQARLTDAGLSDSAANGLSRLVSTAAAASIGAVAGGSSGAAAALNEDANNRQLHPSEARLIRENAGRYASQRGISREQAEAELTQQALRQVDSAWAQRSDNNTAAAGFLQSIVKESGSVAVGGGTLFDARGTVAYTDHTINATSLPQTADLYNRLNSRNTRGITANVGGAYVAYNDAAHDANVATKSPQELQQLLNAGQQLKEQVRTAQEALAVSAANLGVAQTAFNSGIARPGDGSKTTDRLMGEVGEAALTGLPNEGGAVTTPTRNLRPVSATGPELPTTEGNRVNSPARVTAEGESGGETFRDTNQAHRPPVAARPDEPTLIADQVAAREAQTGRARPNGDMATAHGEVGVIQQAWNSGRTQGQDMVMTVEGKDVCGYCQRDVAAMAAQAGLKSLTITATDDKTGRPKTYIWLPGMTSLKEKK